MGGLIGLSVDCILIHQLVRINKCLRYIREVEQVQHKNQNDLIVVNNINISPWKERLLAIWKNATLLPFD